MVTLVTVQSADPADLTTAIAHYGRGQFSEAAEMLARQCANNRACGEARLWLGRSYYKLYRWDDAIRELKTAVQTTPTNSQNHLWLGRAYGGKAAHASFLTALGPAKKVGTEFEAAQRLDPGNLEIRFDLLQFYLNAPGMIGGGRDKAEAQATSIDRLNRRAGQTARACLFEHDKKWPEALKELIQSTLDFPHDPESHGELAEYLFKRNDFVRAEEAAASALALRTWYPMVLWVQAVCRIQQKKDVTAAVASLNRLLEGPLDEQDPNFEDIHYWLGMGCLAQEKKTEARDAFRTALRYDPSHKAAQSALSQLK
jgi:tetratricopeptide (TPR) repeat protein